MIKNSLKIKFKWKFEMLGLYFVLHLSIIYHKLKKVEKWNGRQRTSNFRYIIKDPHPAFEYSDEESD
jgi:hypothetical protein